MSFRFCLMLAMAFAGLLPGALAHGQAPTLAPGVLRTIRPAPLDSETYTGPLGIVELLKNPGLPDWNPNYQPKTATLREIAKRVVLRRDIWNLELSFKPVRMVEVDVPQPSGKMQRKLVWYMVYRVRYPGYELQPVKEVDQWLHETFPTTKPVNRASRRFFPSFVLQSRETGKSYLDRLIPTALEPIRKREMRNSPVKLHDTVEITKVPIPVNGAVWGVAMWEDVDPRIDYFSVYVQGLTNAYRFRDNPDAFKPGDPPGTGRLFAFKTLQLNFWRPGDTEFEHEKEVRYGVPVDFDPDVQARLLKIFGVNERLDHVWVYR